MVLHSALARLVCPGVHQLLCCHPSFLPQPLTSAPLLHLMFRQKKRVTSGEALVGHAKVLYADEISTGLDSNTTYTIVKSLRNICHVMNVSAALG